MLSEIFAVTEGDGLISSRFSRTAAMREAAMRIAEFGFFSSSLLIGAPPLLPASALRCSKQVLLGAGWPLKISVGLYRKAVQQQEQLTITGCCGAGSALSGSACSVCGSTARQVTVQPRHPYSSPCPTLARTYCLASAALRMAAITSPASLRSDP
jgi:hypothetical protein